MDNSQKITLFENTPVPKAVAKLAVPTVLSSLVMVLYNMADTYFVGMLNDPVQNAAVTLAAPVLLAFNAVNNLFGVGSSSMMSRAMGRKDYDTVYRSSAFGFYCAVLSGILFSLLCTVFQGPLLVLLGSDAQTKAATAGYLKWTVFLGATPSILNVVMAYLVRSEGAALHASIGTMCGCILNMILDPIFILPWGFHMGAGGAGLATFLSNCVACLYFFVLLFVRRKTTLVCIRPNMFGFRRSIVKGVCSVGIPASIQNLLNVTGMTILNNFTSVYGPDAVAAMGITQKINMVPMNISMGLSQGIMPLISYNYSSGNVRRMKSTLMFSVKIMLGFILTVSAFYFVAAPAVSGRGFPGRGRFPGHRHGKRSVSLRHPAQDRAGNPRPVRPQPPLPAVRLGLRPAHRGADPVHGRGPRPAPPFPEAGNAGGSAGRAIKCKMTGDAAPRPFQISRPAKGTTASGQSGCGPMCFSIQIM